MNNAYIRLLIYLYTSEKSSADYEIAKVLLNHYALFPDILIEDIARKAHATAATVTKFAHKLGYHTFKEMRMDCHQEEDHLRISNQLAIAQQSYEQACVTYEKEEHEKLSFYMRYHEEQQIQAFVTMLHTAKEIGICYGHYAYPCVHVLRNYISPFQKQVQGVLRDLDTLTLEERLQSSDIIVVISLQGT